MKSFPSRFRWYIAVVILVASPAANACSCLANERGFLGELSDHTDVFVGEVESIATSPTSFQLWIDATRQQVQRALGQQPKPHRFRYQKLVTLRVVERLKDSQTSRLQVATGWAGGNCGVWFDVGKTYLVYARTAADGSRTTSACSPTAPVQERQELLRDLRSLRKASNNSFNPMPLRGTG